MEINSQKAATDAIDILKQVLATKQFEQRFRQEIERQRRERQRRHAIAEPEISDNPTKDQRQLQCLEIGNSTTFRNHEDRGDSNINNQCNWTRSKEKSGEPSDQTPMPLDVYADPLHHPAYSFECDQSITEENR